MNQSSVQKSSAHNQTAGTHHSKQDNDKHFPSKVVKKQKKIQR